MRADWTPAAGFVHYLRRVLGDDGEALVLDGGGDGDGEVSELTRVAVVVGEREDLVERVSLPGLSPRFRNWDGFKAPLPGVEPVVVMDRWDPAQVGATPADFDVLALVTTFNEVDILEQLIDRLIEDGIRVHVVDNWSTDGTYELLQQLAERGLLTYERFPAGGSTGLFELQPLLQRVEDLAHRSGADWVVHHDADEIRQAPWEGVSLRDALFAVDHWGFNCVDHTVVNFRPVEDTWKPGDDLASSFEYYEFGDGPALFVQLKAWKPQSQQVAMARTGGHDAAFSDRRVFPYKFLTRHYPIRSQAQGERKILRERRARWSPEERARGWHTHYDQYGEGSSFIWSREDLDPWSEVGRRHLLERLSGVGLPGNPFEGEQAPSSAPIPFEEADYRATVSVQERTTEPWSFSPKEIRPITALVTNDGRALWRRGGRNGVGLASKWFGPNDDTAGPPLTEGARSHFIVDLAPGERVAQPLSVQAPPEPGTYQLVVDLVHEQVRWFGCGQRIEVEVRG